MIDAFADLRKRLAVMPNFGFRYREFASPILECLNRELWTGPQSEGEIELVGSWPRGTAVAGISNFNIIYELPKAIGENLQRGWKQELEATLMSLEHVLRRQFPDTTLDLATHSLIISRIKPAPICIAPVIRLRNTELARLSADEFGFRQPMELDPSYRALSQLDSIERENYAMICKISRLWKATHKVPISGFLIDTLCLHFISQAALRKKPEKYQDCLLRDFFRYLADQEPRQTSWSLPGSSEAIHRSGAFEPFAATAYSIAQYALDQAAGNEEKSAKSAWRHLLGNYLPPA